MSFWNGNKIEINWIFHIFGKNKLFLCVLGTLQQNMDLICQRERPLIAFSILVEEKWDSPSKIFQIFLRKLFCDKQENFIAIFGCVNFFSSIRQKKSKTYKSKKVVTMHEGPNSRDFHISRSINGITTILGSIRYIFED